MGQLYRWMRRFPRWFTLWKSNLDSSRGRYLSTQSAIALTHVKYDSNWLYFKLLSDRKSNLTKQFNARLFRWLFLVMRQASMFLMIIVDFYAVISMFRGFIKFATHIFSNDYFGLNDLKN